MTADPFWVGFVAGVVTVYMLSFLVMIALVWRGGTGSE